MYTIYNRTFTSPPSHQDFFSRLLRLGHRQEQPHQVADRPRRRVRRDRASLGATRWNSPGKTWGKRGENHDFAGTTWLVGGFNPSEKYESQLGWLFPTYGKIKHVPNHQPDDGFNDV